MRQISVATLVFIGVGSIVTTTILSFVTDWFTVGKLIHSHMDVVATLILVYALSEKREKRIT